MQLQFWGAARTVTGSMHLLEVNGHRVLLDCGLYQGRRKEAFAINRDLPFDARSIDAVILSHAHIDHSGNLPTLVKNGYSGHIYATSATRDLCAHMLLDSAHIQESDVRYVNRKRQAQGKALFEPLYEQPDAVEALRCFRTVDFERPFSPVPGVTVHFINAGHILGAASVVLDLEEDGRHERLVFSGDIGRNGQPILRDPEVASDVDYMIIESTYGDRLHEGSGEARQKLEACIETISSSGGKLIIPSFAVGRTQELVYRLNELWETGQLPTVDIYVDSPLAVKATDVFRLHPECYDQDMLDALMRDDDKDPLGFRNLTYVREVEGSMRLNTLETPAVIISASGMCEGGRILHHLKNHADEPNSIILFVGFQAEGTLGRRILEGESPVRIFGEEHEIRARVDKINGYSAHADRDELLDWALRTHRGGKLRRSFLVHGEPQPMFAFSAALREAGLQHVEVPERGQIFDL
ncbi:MAG: MBL fold metallo-hydrolase [Caldilineae bacterium]|nr:MBL fold metallo-hydrolase [Chloroflexota bacterium]MCB9176847.1 MBL fold metallo-hydrolase [Caldilineae bacterium]